MLVLYKLEVESSCILYISIVAACSFACHILYTNYYNIYRPSFSPTLLIHEGYFLKTKAAKIAALRSPIKDILLLLFYIRLLKLLILLTFFDHQLF
jgi:hypothetical protein